MRVSWHSSRNEREIEKFQRWWAFQGQKSWLILDNIYKIQKNLEHQELKDVITSTVNNVASPLIVSHSFNTATIMLKVRQGVMKQVDISSWEFYLGKNLSVVSLTGIWLEANRAEICCVNFVCARPQYVDSQILLQMFLWRDFLKIRLTFKTVDFE